MKRRTFVGTGLAGTLLATGANALRSDMMNPASISAEFKTPLCDQLSIRYPIIQAGMANAAGIELAAAVSNAGGLGIITATMVPPETITERIREMRRRTSKPFGVNLILHRDLYPPADFDIDATTVQSVQEALNGFRRELGIPESHATPGKLPPLIQAAYEVIVRERVPVFSIGLGNPSAAMVAECHHNGIQVMAMVSSLEDALAVHANRVDVIVAQGSEAGGHRSTWEKKPSAGHAAVGTLPLTAAVVSAVDVPVVAAGGIVNGRGVKAVLALGAQGVLMGTRFLATRESMVSQGYKQAILERSSDDTVITDVYTGMYARVLRNTFTEKYDQSGAPVLPPGRQYAATVDVVNAADAMDRPDYGALYCGQGIDEISGILSAAEVVEEIVREVTAPD